MPPKKSRIVEGDSGSPPPKKTSKKPAPPKNAGDVPKKSAPGKAAPKKPAKKTAKQLQEEKKAANERKTRRFARAARKKKRDDHLGKGLLTKDQKKAIDEISKAVGILNQYLEDDPELFGKLREDMAPSFTILHQLAYKNPDVSQPIAKDLYKANYVAEGDTDDESDDEQDQKPQASAGPGRNRGRKVVVSDEESEDDEPVKELPKRPTKGQSRKNKSEEDVTDQGNNEKPKGKSGSKPRKPTGGHGPQSTKRKESPSDVDDNEGPPAKRLRSRNGTPPSDDDKVKDVQPKTPKSSSSTVKVSTNIKPKKQPKATGENADTSSSRTRSGSQPPEDEVDASTQKRKTRGKK